MSQFSYNYVMQFHNAPDICTKVDPKPYKRFPPRCREQLALACSRTICINRSIVRLHQPDCVPTQFGFASIDPESAPTLPRITGTYSKKGPKQQRNLDAYQNYEIYRNAWSGRIALRGPLLEGWQLQPWMKGWMPVPLRTYQRRLRTELEHVEQPLTPRPRVPVPLQMYQRRLRTGPKHVEQSLSPRPPNHRASRKEIDDDTADSGDEEESFKLVVVDVCSWVIQC